MNRPFLFCVFQRAIRESPLQTERWFERLRGHGALPKNNDTRSPSVFLLCKNPPPSRREAWRRCGRGRGEEIVKSEKVRRWRGKERYEIYYRLPDRGGTGPRTFADLTEIQIREGGDGAEDHCLGKLVEAPQLRGGIGRHVAREERLRFALGLAAQRHRFEARRRNGQLSGAKYT